MKIKVISPVQLKADELARTVSQAAPGVEVLTALLSAGDFLTAVNGSRPNLLVVDDVDSRTLLHLIELSHAFPDVDSIILSKEQSADFLMTAMRAGVRDVLPHPADPHALMAAVQRVVRKRGIGVGAKQAKTLAVMGCKGGNGGSFLAANIAHLLSKRPDTTVGLVDLDLQFGDALLMLSDQRATSHLAAVADNIERLDASLLRAAMVPVTPELLVLPGPPDLSSALEVKAAHVEAIIRQATRMFDYVVLDLSRAVDGVTLKGLDMAEVVMPVVQLSLPNVRDAKRLRDLFRSLEYPAHKIQWIINRYEKGLDISLESFENAIGARGSMTVPNHHASAMASVNHGTPIEALGRNNPIVKALQLVIDKVAPPEIAVRKEGWLASVFGGRQ